MTSKLVSNNSFFLSNYRLVRHYLIISAKYEKFNLTIISLLMLIGVVALNESGIKVHNAFANVLLAMPFFTIGYLMRPYKYRIVSLKQRWMLLILFLGGIVVWFCGSYNDTVFLWKCSYGSNLLLCIIGACFGTTAVYAISRLICPYLADLSQVIGGGTLIILGLHYFFALRVYLPIRSYILPMGEWFLYIDALVILIIFLPIIIICKKYFPFVYGKNRK